MKTNPNESAFPLLIDDISANQYVHCGLTKREYFAAMALSGMLTHLAENEDHARDQMRFRAKDAVFQADALIAELNKEKP